MDLIDLYKVYQDYLTSNNHGDFYCLNCLHSFRTDNALKRHERICKNNDYCKVETHTNLIKL